LADAAPSQGGRAVERLRTRAAFKAAATGKRITRRGFVLQAIGTAPDAPARIGFTVTKKTGNAVVRNRIRRRLKEAVRLAAEAENGTDYVLIGRHAALTLPFETLIADVRSSFAALAGRDSRQRTGSRDDG